MITIGVTGGVGAGKSEILHYLEREYNCRVLLSDDAAKELELPGRVLYEPLVELLSGCGLMEDAAQENLLEENGGGTAKVIVSGGYAEIANDLVIVLADHARRSDDIEPDVVSATREQAVADRDALDPNDHRRAYYENKIRWCDLLLEHAVTD